MGTVTTQASRARAELGWEPTRPGLAEEFRSTSFDREERKSQ